MTITLTAREREVFTSLFDFLELRISTTGAIWAQDIHAWLASQPAETSASPPRVPGASAQCTRAGVESGPGQPMTDICERLEADADGWAAIRNGRRRVQEAPAATAALEREAAAEIRRLRDQVAAYRTGGGVIGDIRATNAYRAGIEAAAKWHEAQAGYCDSFSGGGWHLHAQRDQHHEYAKALRALADAPAREEVESGPGQPMDICTHLDATARLWKGSAVADALEAAAAEIRRLREREQMLKIDVANEQITSKESYRAGIETAAHRIETFTFSPGLHAYTVSAVKNVLSQVVRALAYAPKSDPLPANEWPTHVEMERE